MSANTVGFLGYGKIATSLHERIDESTEIEVSYIYSRGSVEPIIDGADVIDHDAVTDRSVDMVIEAATRDVVDDLGESVLQQSDLLVLSTTALADSAVAGALTDACTANETRVYVPHGAILGMDGLQDARETLDDVRIETRKNPSNIDFSFTDIDGKIEGETILYVGPTRGICEEFPRNVNSHATVALSGLGFDETHSTLIADPTASEATHRITAEGDGTRLEIERASAIEGVTGDYTLHSIWGSVRRALDDNAELIMV